MTVRILDGPFAGTHTVSFYGYGWVVTQCGRRVSDTADEPVSMQRMSDNNETVTCPGCQPQPLPQFLQGEKR